MSQAYEPSPDPNLTPTSGPTTDVKNGRCLLYGCVGVFVGGILLILCAGIGTYYAVQKQVKRYTSTEPLDLPTVSYSEEKLDQLEARIESFQSNFDEPSSKEQPADESDGVVDDEAAAVDEASGDAERVEAADAPEALRELILSADDINALIGKDENLRGRVLVRVADGQVTGDVSIPIESFIPGSKGRYFNGSGSFDVKLEGGVLLVTLESAEVKGEPIPEAFMQGIRKENLAKELYKDKKTARIIRQFDSIEIEDDRIIAKLRQPQPE